MTSLYKPGDSRDSVSTRLAQGRGYAVRFPRIHNFTWSSANGWLYAPNGKYMPLFISEYNTSFELAGSMGQSQMVRDFYPRNFTQPDFTIIGQSPNQYYYNRLGEFIRYFQRETIFRASPGRILVATGGYPVRNRNPHVSMRGRNHGFKAEGYVKQIERGAERFQFTPDFSFDFTVSTMHTGLYKEKPTKIRRLRSWAEIIKDPSHAWTVDPDAVSALSDALDAIEPPFAGGTGGGTIDTG